MCPERYSDMFPSTLPFSHVLQSSAKLHRKHISALCLVEVEQIKERCHTDEILPYTE